MTPARRLSAIMIVCLFLLAARLAMAQEPPAAPEAAFPTADLPRIIEMLEDDQQRAQVLNLLKLMAASGAKAPGVAPAEPPPPAAEAWEGAIWELAGSTWQNIELSGPGLVQALNRAAEGLKSLFTPRALELWPAYFQAIFAWGLFCLLVSWFVARRWGRLPAIIADLNYPDRLGLFLRHILVVSAPNLVLIVSLGLWPKLPTTTPGITADLALSFIFLQALVKHLFINCSLLYIALKAASALLVPNGDDATLSGLPAPLAHRLLSAWRFLAIYLAALIFFKEIFLDQFVLGRTYAVVLALLVIPLPLVLTVKLWRLRSQVETTAKEPGIMCAGRPAYLTDYIFRECWVFFSIGAIWLAAWAYLAEAAVFFSGRLLGSLAVVGLSLGAIKAARFLFANLVKPAPADESRRLLVTADSLIGLAVGLAAFCIILVIWGLPLGRLLENSLAREILGRALVISMTSAALVLFLKFNRLAAEWLLAVPVLSGNRNWRTMAPLVITGTRGLAVFLAVVIVLERLGVNVGPILAGVGILGLGVGLGAQSLVKDLINGISILSMNIAAVGDNVTIGSHSGTVEQVGLRSLRLRDIYGDLILIPNSGIDTIINRAQGLSHRLLEIVMPPDADPDELLTLTRAVAEDFNADAEWRSRLARPVAVVGVTGFDSDGTTIRLRLTTPAGEQWEPEWELKRRLKQRLLQAGHNSRAFARVVVNLVPE